MSCNTLNSQPVRLTVTVGNLPEGYCLSTFQQLLNDFAARLIVTPNQNNSTFVTGSIEPTSNVGPWLKDCLQWFVFNDSTGRYQPITKGGFDTMQYFTTSGTFTVPDNIFKLKITAIGAGGGAADQAGGTAPSSGGGGGGFGMSIVSVTPSQVISYTIGAGGATGTPSGTPGGATIILGKTANGGGPGLNTSNPAGGAGGTATGFDVNISGGAGHSQLSNSNLPGGAGGHAGGWGGSGGSPKDNQAGVVPGGGGGGCTGGSGTGGAGGGGAILIEY